jgi:type IV pilus assembly protein PilE
MHKVRGLTLVELMVVVAVMAIIATIAYPIYTNQVQKSRRADAKAALESIALAQERWYTINSSYAVTLSSLQISADLQGGASDSGYYNVALAGGGQTFTATATATGAQSGDSGCATFAVNHLGVKTATSANCW